MKTEPVDIVICWVDGNDPEWRKEKDYWEQKTSDRQKNAIDEAWNKGEIRYRDWGTLKYFFRGIDRYAPWVRNIYFVTWGHMPIWLNAHHPKLKIIRHDEYIPKEFLPTFNSHTIELNLHRIPGLSEQFIYFNDDQFITGQTRHTDFFNGGLPCDSAVLNPVPMTRRIGHAEINNIGIINDHFDKQKVISTHPFKWFNLKYGTKLMRNILLMPWTNFMGLYEQHLPTSFLKSTFEKVWKTEEQELINTCSCKFRDRSNVNQWLMKNWQIVTGQFSPRSFRIGSMYMYGENNNYDQVCKQVSKGNKKLLCINDTEDIDDFQKRKDQLLQAFDQLLPEKVQYEI